MWKRDETPESSTNHVDTGRPIDRAAPPPRSGERATIGRSITIRGDVTGDEDLLIQGRVEGSVDLDQHSVTVGPEGEVNANITARIVTIEGQVKGDLRADEQIVLRSSARVQGDAAAPRVVLEDGARFRGGIDMGEDTGRAANRSSVSAPKTDPRKATTGASEGSKGPGETAAKGRSGSSTAAEAAG